MAVGATRRDFIRASLLGTASLLLPACGKKEKDWDEMMKCVKAKDAIRGNAILSNIREGKRGPIMHFSIAPFNAETEEAVRIVQLALQSLDYNVKADGNYGDATARALKDLQIKNGIPIDWANGNNGKKLGQRTMEALWKELCKHDPIL